MKFSRCWAMPNKNTFEISPIEKLLACRIDNGHIWLDPFAKNSEWATITNDFNVETSAQYHLDAGDFLRLFDSSYADGILFDPPYSPRQISEHYRAANIEVSTKHTQNARLYKRVKDEMDRVTRPNGIIICFGWNSNGMGVTRGYELIEILLVAHGAAHNDTIVTVEKAPMGL